MDLIHDSLRGGKALNTLVVIDEFTREYSALDVGRSITSDRVLDVLVELFVDHGVPSHLRCDNGPEFVAKTLHQHLVNSDVETLYIEPGSPWGNGYVESFNSRFRDELLNMEEFENMKEARWHIERWRQAYNTERPRSSLGYQTPAEFAARCYASASAAPTLQQNNGPQSLLTIT